MTQLFNNNQKDIRIAELRSQVHELRQKSVDNQQMKILLDRKALLNDQITAITKKIKQPPHLQYQGVIQDLIRQKEDMKYQLDLARKVCNDEQFFRNQAKHTIGDVDNLITKEKVLHETQKMTLDLVKREINEYETEIKKNMLEKQDYMDKMDTLLQQISSMNKELDIQEQHHALLQEKLQQSMYVLEDTLSLEEKFRQELVQDDQEDRMVSRRGELFQETLREVVDETNSLNQIIDDLEEQKSTHQEIFEKLEEENRNHEQVFIDMEQYEIQQLKKIEILQLEMQDQEKEISYLEKQNVSLTKTKNKLFSQIEEKSIQLEQQIEKIIQNSSSSYVGTIMSRWNIIGSKIRNLLTMDT